MGGKRNREHTNTPATPHTRKGQAARARSAHEIWDSSPADRAPANGRPASSTSFPTLSSMPRVRRSTSELDWPMGDGDALQMRQRAASSARPLTRLTPTSERSDDAEWEDYATWDDDGEWEDKDTGESDYATHALAVRPQEPPMPSRGAPIAHPRVATQRLLKRVRSRWSLVRLGLVIAAAVVALGVSFGQVGEPAQPFMALQARAASRGALNVAQQVKPLTSLKRPDQYDNPTQFAIYSPAACSPSSMAEVLTAWGVPHATIGRMIDDLGSYLSPNWGLLDQKGFEVAAAKEGFRADISWNLTYNQILYLTNVLGLPVIFNVRRDWGYYHYFAGGHFLTVTGGDQQGVSIVDSSEYYITYLSRDVFLSLWQWRSDGSAQTIVLVPADYQYTLPSNLG